MKDTGRKETRKSLSHFHPSWDKGVTHFSENVERVKGTLNQNPISRNFQKGERFPRTTFVIFTFKIEIAPK